MRPSLMHIAGSAALGTACIITGAVTGGSAASAKIHANHQSPHHTSVVLTASDSYMVQPGDTLSTIAATHDVQGGWQALYSMNSGIIRNPNVIYPDQTLKLDGTYNAAAIQPAALSQPAVQQAPMQQSASASAPVSTAGDSGFQQCVIQRESGGDPNIWNQSGHYGLYQFDEQTWVSGGGAAADFGHASVAEQNQVFANVYAARGAQPWAPSDGC